MIPKMNVLDHSQYNLPVCDVDTERRNFEGFHKYEDLIDLDLGDSEGTTDTDSKTDTSDKKRNNYPSRRNNMSKGYTRINNLKGKNR